MGKALGAGEIPEDVARRLADDVDSALKKRPANEAKLAGALRVLAPFSATLRDVLAEAQATLTKKATFDRELYATSVRAGVEAGDKRAGATLALALATDDAGGLTSLSAACFCKAPALTAPLGRASMSRHAQLAFAAELARTARGEATGQRLVSLAPVLKEAYRISLSVDVLLPLTRAGHLHADIAPALAVLRDAERHLGRWLVFAEVATRAGDPAPLAEARERAGSGPQSARTAWALLAWALDSAKGQPSARPTVEIVARLSERPSADRDMSFLFRVAATGAASARPMLEGLARPLPLANDVSIRAARCLVRRYGRAEMRRALVEACETVLDEDLRAFLAASLWDVGEHDAARAAMKGFADTRSPTALAWLGLLHRAEAHPDEPIVDELRFRRAQRGWVE
jgi:hypothetical protein